MEKINITISDGLTPAQEIMAIAKKLGKALAPPKTQTAIGQGYEVKHLETQITIKREPSSPLLVTQNCSVCDTIFEMKEGLPLYINYGGTVNKRRYCSDECRQQVIDICGPGRAVPKKKDLKMYRDFNRSTRREHVEIENPTPLRNMTPFTAWDIIAKQGLE